MKFTVTITCDNAAFQDGNLTSELQTILQGVGERLAFMLHSGKGSILDTNGNLVGTCKFSGTQPREGRHP